MYRSLPSKDPSSPRWLKPKLTTIDRGLHKMGWRAIERLTGADPPARLGVPTDDASEPRVNDRTTAGDPSPVG